MSETDPNDPTKRLVEAAKSGDGEALDQLIRRHLPALRAFCRLKSDPRIRAKEAASDLVQTACRQALQHIDDYSWQGPSSFRNWLFSFAMQKINNRRQFYSAERRSTQREASGGFDGDLADAYAATLSTPSRLAMNREAIEQLESVMDALPADYREVIVLARIVQLPHAEIAEKIGRSEGATRVLLSRALARLATLIDEQDRDD